MGGGSVRANEGLSVEPLTNKSSLSRLAAVRRARVFIKAAPVGRYTEQRGHFPSATHARAHTHTYTHIQAQHTCAHTHKLTISLHTRVRAAA